MSLFFIVCLLCIPAIPLTVAYFAGPVMFAPVLVAVRTLRLRGRPRRQLAATTLQGRWGEGVSPEFKKILDERALARKRLGATYHTAEIDGLRVLLRAQPRTVDDLGHEVGLPLTRQQRREAQLVASSWIMIDLRDHLPLFLHLHAQLSPDETILGDESLAAALLDGRMRSVLRKGDQLVIAEGWLGLDSPFVVRDAALERTVAELVRMAGRLAEVGDRVHIDAVPLLVETFENDEDASARARAIDALLERYEDTEEAEAATEGALKDPAAEVRFAAARHLGERGFNIALAVVHDDEAPDGLRQRALRYLLRWFSQERVLPVVEQVVRQGPERLRQIGIRHIGALRYRPGLPWLAEAASSPDPQTALDIAQALVDLRDAQATPVLVLLLERPSLDIKVAAVEALGLVGDAEVLPKLQAYAQSNRVDRTLKLAAISAVHHVRSRFRAAGGGALSVVAEAEEAGHLTVVDSPQGAVSLPANTTSDQASSVTEPQ